MAVKRGLLARRARHALIAAGAIGLVSIGAWVPLLIWGSASVPDPHIIWLYDWHVYAAGGTALVERELYTAPLAFPGWPIPVDTYNLPPFSAVLTIPLLLLPDVVAGSIWVLIGAVSWTVAWWLALRSVRAPLAWAWTGLALGTYAVAFYWFAANLLLGNVNHLVLVAVVIAVLAIHRGHHRTAGIVLGLAIATKIWPAVLLVPLARDGGWREIRWSIGAATIATVIPMAWLGIDAIVPMLQAMQLRVPIEPGVAVLWTSALRESIDWWPSWGGIATGVALLVVPARGLAGIGLAILAGISVIPNIWDHYLPTLLVGVVFAAPAAFKAARRNVAGASAIRVPASG